MDNVKKIMQAAEALGVTKDKFGDLALKVVVGSGSTAVGQVTEYQKRAQETTIQKEKLAQETTMQKEKLAAEMRQEKVKQEHEIRLHQLAEAAKDKEAKRQRALKEMEFKEAQKQREHERREKERQKEHEAALERLELEKKQKQMEIEAQAQKHQEDLKKMEIDAQEKDRANKEKQRDDALTRVKTVISDLEKQNAKHEEEMITIKEEHELIVELVKNQGRNIDNFDKEGKLNTEREDMERVHAEWKRNDDEILAAIEKTGEHEDNVARFLRLTEGLIKETVSSEAQANKLDAELNTFFELLSRECQDNLEIDTWFRKKRLVRFIPILKQEKFNECQDLVCKDDEEFEEEVLSVLKEGIDKQVKQWKRKNPNVVDPFDTFLEHYKLMKYKQALRKGGLESLDDIDEDLADEDIDELISIAKIKALHKKRVKKAIKDVQTGAYEKPKEGETKQMNDDNDNINVDEQKETDKRPRQISSKEERLLRAICVHPEEWQGFEKIKAASTKSSLLEMTPVLCQFFSKMHLKIQQVQKLLHYGHNQNQEQKKAYSLLDSVKPKAIEAANDDSKEEKEDPTYLPDYEQRNNWKEASQIQVYSESIQKWYDGTIIKVDGNNQREIEVKYDTGSHQRTKQIDRFGKDARDPVMTECVVIEAAIDVDINVVDIMYEEFNVSQITRRGLILAQGVEQSSKAIILCQSRIRQAMRLAESVLKLKPANLTDKSKPLWDAVNDGITHIIKAALEMSTISAQYFGFFLKFNQSLQTFISMNQNKDDAPLILSLEHLKRDVRQFSEFKGAFNAKLQALSRDAMKVIENCVKTHIGIETFNKAQIEREKSKKQYLEKKSIYDKKSLLLDNELETLCIKRANDRATQAKYDIKMKLTTQSIEQNRKDIQLFRNRQSELNALNFDTFENDGDNKTNNQNDKPKATKKGKK